MNRLSDRWIDKEIEVDREIDKAIDGWTINYRVVTSNSYKVIEQNDLQRKHEFQQYFFFSLQDWECSKFSTRDISLDVRWCQILHE